MVFIENAFQEEQPQIDHAKKEHLPQRRISPLRSVFFRWFFFGAMCAIVVYVFLAWILYGQVKGMLA